jgi:hypothetical protein
MEGIEPGSLVITHCTNPKEKVWGALVRLDVVGIVIRGLDLNSVEDWLQQQRSGADPLIGPFTFFVPAHRILRVDLDESVGVVTSYGDRYAAACGHDVRIALFGQLDEGERSDA